MADRVIPCPWCAGDGTQQEHDAMSEAYEIACIACNGSGTIPDRSKDINNTALRQVLDELCRAVFYDRHYQTATPDGRPLDTPSAEVNSLRDEIVSKYGRAPTANDRAVGRIKSLCEYTTKIDRPIPCEALRTSSERRPNVDELKSCPFCGGPAAAGCAGVCCNDCHPLDGLGFVAATWERRPIEDALRAEIAALQADHRAVERIKNMAQSVVEGVNPNDFTKGQEVMAVELLRIIREEAERD